MLDDSAAASRLKRLELTLDTFFVEGVAGKSEPLA
jgi:hypothetical protein